MPASITAGTPNTCSIEVPLANLNKKNNIEQVIALVLDTRTGVVVNAEAKRFDGGESSGIESAAADASATVTGAAGEIIINGNFSRADVYTLSGVLVGRTSALAPGVYVVNVDGRAHKVMVR